MYDTYTRYIYDWLINNDIADKLSDLINISHDILHTLVFFGFVYVGFKFLKKEWLSY